MLFIWDVLAIFLILCFLYAGREWRIIRARARAQNWGSF
jgi:hypothetical protein